MSHVQDSSLSLGMTKRGNDNLPNIPLDNSNKGRRKSEIERSKFEINQESP